LVSAKAPDTEERIRVVTTALAALGVEVVGTVVQRRGVSRSKSPGGSKRLETPLNSATIIGPGKMEELALLVRESGAHVVYFLNDLSSAQSQRLGAQTGCPVIPCLNESKPPLPNLAG
jgi:50S ribosomal subunit-associated GTPase HflX